MIERPAEPGGAVSVAEPFPEYAWPEVWGWMGDLRNRITDDYGAQTLDEFVTWGLRMSARSRTWGVWRAGELGGLITFVAANPVTGYMHVVFRKSFWGSATTVAAIHLVFAALFGEGVRKIACQVFQDNHAVRALGRRCGVREEGLLLGHTMRGGQAVNVIALGIRKEDFDGESR